MEALYAAPCTHDIERSTAQAFIMGFAVSEGLQHRGNIGRLGGGNRKNLLQMGLDHPTSSQGTKSGKSIGPYDVFDCRI